MGNFVGFYFSKFVYLEAKQLIERIQFNEIPPHVEYKATDKTKELRKVFEAVSEWESKNL